MEDKCAHSVSTDFVIAESHYFAAHCAVFCGNDVIAQNASRAFGVPEYSTLTVLLTAAAARELFFALCCNCISSPGNFGYDVMRDTDNCGHLMNGDTTIGSENRKALDDLDAISLMALLVITK